MKKYNKLVRDLIPEIIETSGKRCEVEKVESSQMLQLLEDKMSEEFNEFLEERNLEELADVMEVVFGLAHVLGYSEEQLLNKRRSKLKERGGFKEGIVLKKVY